MLTYFRVKGFKNFSEDLTFDLAKPAKYVFNNEQIKDGIINKGIIYGKNGSGKSNLGEALFDIAQNAVLMMPSLSLPNQIIQPVQKGIYRSLNYKKDIEFEYHFNFSNVNIIYLYTKKESRFIISEKLIVDNNVVLNYELNKEKYCIIEEAKNVNFDNMNQGNSMLFYLFNFIKFNVDSPILKLYNFIKGMLWFRCLNQGNEAIGMPAHYDFIEDAIIRENKVQNFEDFLSSFNINYKLVVSENITYNGLSLPQKKKIIMAKYGGEKAPLSLLLSTGTIALELFFYWKMHFDKVTFLFIDEFDAFYHYELSAKIIEMLNKETHFQSFVTTHNTFLMNTDLMRPDTLFLLNNNVIKPLSKCSYGELREGHNLEKIYRSGGFDD